MTFNFSKSAPKAKTLEEAQGVIDALWGMVIAQGAQIEEQAKQIASLSAKVKELEEKLSTNSKNSSKPPSTDLGSSPPKKQTGSGRKAGGQPGREGKAREWIPEAGVDEIVPCYPASECECGGEVKASESYTPHQTIELPPIRFIVNEYRCHSGICQGCGKRHDAMLPSGVGYGFLGARTLALVGTLTGGYRLSKRLVQSLLHDLFGQEISVGTISQAEETVSEALKPITEAAHEHVKQAKQVHCDETGHKEKGKRQWMWVAIAGMVSVFLARASRSAEVAKELLGDCFAGWLISDRYSAYTWIEACRRQVCWAHLLRDFTKIAERKGLSGPIGERLLAAAKHMFDAWHRVRDGALSREAFQKQMKPIQADVEAALAQGAACTGDSESKTAATCKRLLTLKEALWLFVREPGIEPTNNLAERTIRHYVIWRKISFGSQSQRGSLYAERIMTTVGSCKLQGRNVFDFLTSALRAHLGNGQRPSLISP
jgi:transposase